MTINFITYKKNERGFTLIEMLVVLVILSSVLLITAPIIRSKPEAIELRHASLGVASMLRETRAYAVRHNRSASFSFDIKKRKYWSLNKGRSQKVSKRIIVSILSAQEERVEQDIGRIRFFVDGSSTGGQIILQSQNHKDIISIDWLSGKVIVE